MKKYFGWKGYQEHVTLMMTILVGGSPDRSWRSRPQPMPAIPWVIRLASSQGLRHIWLLRTL